MVLPGNMKLRPCQRIESWTSDQAFSEGFIWGRVSVTLFVLPGWSPHFLGFLDRYVETFQGRYFQSSFATLSNNIRCESPGDSIAQFFSNILFFGPGVLFYIFVLRWLAF
ncbi:hypothetical protein F4815DRAFT_482579 [Daldinia loculata]|nr:hypothetical protein F4815DRAFT_482579 [Daldinia loculata]